jgi:small conductance mechanosensitive channel
VNASDYWGVYFDMNEKFYKGADKKGLSIPFPQLDVHMDK